MLRHQALPSCSNPSSPCPDRPGTGPPPLVLVVTPCLEWFAVGAGLAIGVATAGAVPFAGAAEPPLVRVVTAPDAGARWTLPPVDAGRTWLVTGPLPSAGSCPERS